MAQRLTIQPVRSSARTVTCAVLEPSVGLGRGRRVAHDDERLSVVRLVQHVEQLARRERRVRRRGPGVASGEDPPVHGREVRREEHLRAEVLFDLGRVPVVEQPIGDEVLVRAAERVLASSRAGHAACGIDHDAGRLDQPGSSERRKRERGCGRVATGCGDEARRT